MKRKFFQKEFKLPVDFSKGEMLVVFFLAVLACTLVFLPTIVAYFKTAPGYWFSGFNFFYDPWDINTYLANIRQGFNGQWFYRNPYTSFPDKALPIYLFYILLGHFSRVTALPILLVYHAANIVLTALFCFVLYIFLAFFFTKRNVRLSTFFLILFGGGLGWLLLPIGIPSVDIIYPDGAVFQMLHLPHFVLNQVLFLSTLLFSFGSSYFKRWSLVFGAGFSGVLLAFIHPYSLLAVTLIVLGYSCLLFVRKRNMNTIFYLGPLLTLWTLTLIIFRLLLKPTLLFDQVATSPQPWLLFLSYGFLSLFAIWGALTYWRKRDEKSLFLFSWFVVHSLVLYLPFSFQRFNLKGFFIILGICAVVGIEKLVSLIRDRRVVYTVILFFSSFNALIITIVPLTFVVPLTSRHFETWHNWIYLTVEEKSAFNFLLKNSQKGEVVLASFRISDFLPVYTDNRVHLGRDLVVFDWKGAVQDIPKFYSGKLSVPPYQYLKEGKIDYIFWGDDEKALGDFDLTKESYLENIYQNEKVIVFKVK